MIFDNNYITFKLPKKNNNGYRTISIPDPHLKQFQQKILQKLYQVAKEKNINFKFSYGFLPHKNVVDNAWLHCKKKFTLNIDIENFFDNCTSTNCPPLLLSLLEQIGVDKDVVFYKNKLPQGAPTSPFCSNFYMINADNELFSTLKYIITDDLVYTRYADDLTFSSNSKAIFSKVMLDKIEEILKKNNFKINKKKIVRFTPSMRKTITGVVINSGVPTISQQIRKRLRASIHYIEQGKIPSTPIPTIVGWLSVLQQFPTHKQWAKEQLEKIKEKEII